MYTAPRIWERGMKAAEAEYQKEIRREKSVVVG
jgi:hypothetical protein